MNLIAVPTLVLSFIMVSRGAGWLTDSICHISAGKGISIGVLGMVLAGFITTLPELTVSTMASALKDVELSVGNAVGSAIFNVLGIVGICGLVRPLHFDRSFLLDSARNALLVYVAFCVIGAIGSSIGGADSLALFAILALSLFYSYRRRSARVPQTSSVPGTLARDVARVLVGGAVLGIGSYLLIYSATSLASDLGVPRLVIGLSLVAVGTSIPELATGLASAKRGVEEISIGNILGANIYDITLVLGCSALVSTLLHHTPLPLGGTLLFFSIPVMMGATAFLMIAGRHGTISRTTSGLMLCAYVAYIVVTYSGVL